MYDVAIIGGGVVGCSVLDELTLNGFKCCLIEKEKDLISGASSGNSGQIDLFNEDPNSLEYKCLKIAREQNEKFFRNSNLPYQPVGGLVLAWSKSEVITLHKMLKSFHKEGFKDCRLVKPTELYDLEPHLKRGVCLALLLPHITLVDPWLTPILRAHRAKKNKATILTGSEVHRGKQLSGGEWILDTDYGEVAAKMVINAAGLYGDEVEKIVEAKPGFDIQPRKGQYIVYAKSAGQLVNHALFQIPTDQGRGVIIFPTVYGNLLVGPTASQTITRRHPSLEAEVEDSLERYAHDVIPALSTHKIMTSYAGLRPGSNKKDYVIQVDSNRHWLTLAGIRSTGVSSSVGLSKYVTKLIATQIKPTQNPALIQHTSLPVNYHVVSPGCGSLAVEDVEYKITHILSKSGLDEQSLRKSKL